MGGMPKHTAPLSRFFGFSPVDLVEADFVPQALSPADEPSGYVRGYHLAPALVMRDVPLGDADSRRHCGLGHSELLANGLDCIHEPILAMLLVMVNSIAGCDAEQQR